MNYYPRASGWPERNRRLCTQGHRVAETYDVSSTLIRFRGLLDRLEVVLSATTVVDTCNHLSTGQSVNYGGGWLAILAATQGGGRRTCCRWRSWRYRKMTGTKQMARMFIYFSDYLP